MNTAGNTVSEIDPQPLPGNPRICVRTESRGVVVFEVEFLGAYVPLSIAARALSRSGESSAMEVSER